LEELGARRNVAGKESVLIGRARVDNVDYELWRGQTQHAVRVFDHDSQELVSLSVYSDPQQALRAFEKAVARSGGTPERLEEDGATDARARA
ncbi:hypothetical protein, partial [Streptococcus pneumoniae]|uniref:hypothetical protein n=1 Tax=Streptococcus pneumoniae TaxID=1313 RepID=UPI0016621D94